MKRIYKNKERNKIRRIVKLKKANKSSILRKHSKNRLILRNELKMIWLISFVVIAVVVIVGVIIFFNISTSSNLVTVFDVPIKDKAALNRIVLRINQEGIKTSVTPDGLILVADEITARRMRAILISEDLIPTDIEPWVIFNKYRWALIDFERNISFQLAQQMMIANHIKAIDDVDDAKVYIAWPKKELFLSDQKPVAVSVIITPKPGIYITRNRKQIEGIQRLLKIAIEGLQDENIIILDNNAVLLNNFGNIAE